MLTISQGQWLLLEAGFTGMTLSRLTGYLREHFGEACRTQSPDALQHLAETSLHDSRAAGFSDFRDHCAYASMSLLDPGFERHPPVQAILLEQPAPDDTRMTRILASLAADPVERVAS